jgi:F-type H+-transporting ATPase subunit alpha
VTTEGRDIVAVIKDQIERFGASLTMVDVGSVVEVGDGIARIHGLQGAKYNELLEFPNEIMGLAMKFDARGELLKSRWAIHLLDVS